jgi:hypothetical protein
MGLHPNGTLSVILVRFPPLNTDSGGANANADAGVGVDEAVDSVGDGVGAGAPLLVNVMLTIPSIYIHPQPHPHPWIERIDEACCTNPRTVWERMGSPKHLTVAQRDELMAASVLQRVPVTLTPDDSGNINTNYTVEVSLPPYSVVHLHI